MEPRLPITSGMDKDLLSHGSLDAETLSSMKLESTANPWVRILNEILLMMMMMMKY